MKRILLLLAVSAFMVAMLVIGTGAALALEGPQNAKVKPPGVSPSSDGLGTANFAFNNQGCSGQC